MSSDMITDQFLGSKIGKCVTDHYKALGIRFPCDSANLVEVSSCVRSDCDRNGGKNRREVASRTQ